MKPLPLPCRGTTRHRKQAEGNLVLRLDAVPARQSGEVVPRRSAPCSRRLRCQNLSSGSMIRSTGYRKLWLLVALVIVPLGPASGQSHLTGSVVDASTEKPLSGASVFIDGKRKGAATDKQGRFLLEGLTPGRYTVVASMVGYETRSKSVVVRDSSRAGTAARSLKFELQRDPVGMDGVTVEGSREKWLDRLQELREAFFGTVENAEKCSFVNPEVLAFEKSKAGLTARANRPLRVRNEALGYELTYYLSRYTFDPEGPLGRRFRFGPVEFDTLEARSSSERRSWREARLEAYRGSFGHFIDALQSSALREEGFIVSITDEISIQTRSTQGSERGRIPDRPSSRPLTDSDQLLSSTRVPGQRLLSVPRAGDLIKVTYTREGESRTYARMYRKRSRTRSRQTSWVQIEGGTQVLVDVHTGDFLPSGSSYYLLRGYWGWHQTAATKLPGGYDPPSNAP